MIKNKILTKLQNEHNNTRETLTDRDRDKDRDKEHKLFFYNSLLFSSSYEKFRKNF